MKESNYGGVDMKVLIIVPAYNEELNIFNTIKKN